MPPDLAITPQGLAITGLHLTDSDRAVVLEGLTAQERIALDTPPPRWRPWAWAVAVVLHVAAIAFLLLFARVKPPADQSPPGVSVVFDNGGAPSTSAPQAQLKGPTTVAQSPPPPAPPPPAAQTQPEVNLNMPDQPFATMQSAPTPQVEAKAAPPPRPRPVTRPAPKYTVMNNMSYGSTAVPTPDSKRALNMDLAQSDSDAVNKPELAIKGDIGADWGAALSAWVEAHKYYPQAALEQGQQGSAEVEFTVDRAGNVTKVHLLSSAGSTFLDQAWTGLFAQNQLPPFPPGTKSDHIVVDATMHYEILH